MARPETSALRERFGRTAGGPRVFGHRGASARAPENTLAAFALAMDEGADGVELDVRRCASGEIVVMHDPTLSRTTGDPRAVTRATLAELRGLDAGRGERVPLLDEALDLVLARGGAVNVEVKADADDRSLLVRRVATTLARRSAKDRQSVAISTFDPRVLWALRLERVEVGLLFLFEDTRQGRLLGRAVPRVSPPDGVNPQHVLVTADRVARWRARGLLVTPWTTDGDALVTRLASAGVDALITNDPAGTRQALR